MGIHKIIFVLDFLRNYLLSHNMRLVNTPAQCSIKETYLNYESTLGYMFEDNHLSVHTYINNT